MIIIYRLPSMDCKKGDCLQSSWVTTYVAASSHSTMPSQPFDSSVVVQPQQQQQQPVIQPCHRSLLTRTVQGMATQYAGARKTYARICHAKITTRAFSRRAAWCQIMCLYFLVIKCNDWRLLIGQDELP